LTAELGEINNKYCLVLTQLQDGVKTKVTFLVETEDGKIISASSCFLPAPQKITMLGFIPK